MPHWMCTTCGYYLQGPAPPDQCPSCKQGCNFNDVTCHRPECGGEQNLDPLLVGSTLKTLKGALEPAPQPAKPPLPPIETLPMVEILKGLSEKQKQEIRNLGHTEHYKPDTVICTEGAAARKFYLLEEGQVAVESRLAKGRRIPISAVSPGQAFGWSALVQPYLYTATVMALSKTRVIAIEQEALLGLMQANPSLGLMIMQNVASIVSSRLRNLELALVGLLQQGR